MSFILFRSVCLSRKISIEILFFADYSSLTALLILLISYLVNNVVGYGHGLRRRTLRTL